MAGNERLGQVLKRSKREPDRVLVTGTEKVGKTTFAAGAPDPIVIDLEGGLGDIPVQSFPRRFDYQEVLLDVKALLAEEHDYKTVIIDTLDALESMVYAHVCKRERWTNEEGHPDIEKPGYGRGYQTAAAEWRRLLAGLDMLRHQRGMQVILVSHVRVATRSPPHLASDYSAYEICLDKRARDLVKGWVDTILFAVREDRVDAKRRKATSTGQRLMHTQGSAAWDAGNRWGLPAVLPLDWAEYEAARDASSDPAPVLDDCKALLEQMEAAGLDDAEADRIATKLNKVAADRVALIKVRDAMLVRLEELGRENEEVVDATA